MSVIEAQTPFVSAEIPFEESLATAKEILRGTDWAAFDFDSTLSSIEGPPSLAGIKSPTLQRDVSNVNSSSLNGAQSIFDTMKKKYDAISPTQQMVMQLGEQYRISMDPECITMLKALTDHDLKIGVLGAISGGLKDPITYALAKNGINMPVYANDIRFNADGMFDTLNDQSYFVQDFGKCMIIQELRKQGHIHGTVTMIGDSAHDTQALTNPYSIEEEGATSFIQFDRYLQNENVDSSIRTNDFGVLLVLLTGTDNWKNIIDGKNEPARGLLKNGMDKILNDPEAIRFKDPLVAALVRDHITYFVNNHIPVLHHNNQYT